MKKVLAWFLLVIVLPANFAGCRPALQSSAPEQGPALAYICKDMSQPWYSSLAESFRASAIASGAKEVLLIDCEMSSLNYLIALDDVITRGVDCVVVCPPDQRTGQLTASKCAEADVLLLAAPEALYDSGGLLLAPSMTIDAVQCGQAMGYRLGSYLQKEKLGIEKIGLICLTMKQNEEYKNACINAVNTFCAQVPAFLPEHIYYANYDGTSQSGFNAAASVITAHPGVKIWLGMAMNDEGAAGICQVLEQSGKTEHAAVVGMGGYLARQQWESGVSSFQATVFIDAEAAGADLALAVLNWCNIEEVPWQDSTELPQRDGLCRLPGKIIVRNQ